jgi:RNA polymerase sigma-70 factor (ECF subfamily)
VAGSTPEDVFIRHRRDIYRYLVRMTGRPDAADDLSQDVFLRVVRALRNGSPVGHERGWVFSIARNLVRDRQRSQRTGPVMVETFNEPATAGTQALAFGLAEALAALADDDREVFLLKEIGGLSYAEIAAACTCSVEAVRSRLFRTRAALRTTLAVER